MIVLSDFDGMSVGQLALSRVGVKPKRYYACEIDPYAMQVTRKNFPGTRYLGNVRNISARGLGHVDLLLGGSPCQGFSRAGAGLNFDDPRSRLFFDYARHLEECQRVNPDVKFLLENVWMKQDWQDVISEYLGVQPIVLNSNLVSAQNRKRLYWTNLPVRVPVDRKIFLKDIILPDALPVTLTEARTEEAKLIRREFLAQGRDFSPRRAKELVERTDGKSNCLTTKMRHTENLIMVNESLWLTPKQIARGYQTHAAQTYRTGNKMGNMAFPNDVSKKSKCLTTSPIKGNRATNHIYQEGRFRMLSPIECERLQTLPDNYTAGVSDTQRYKMIGNGWTADLIADAFFWSLGQTR